MAVWVVHCMTMNGVFWSCAVPRSCREVMDSNPCCFLSMGGLDARLQGSQDEKALHAATSKAVPFSLRHFSWNLW